MSDYTIKFSNSPSAQDLPIFQLAPTLPPALAQAWKTAVPVAGAMAGTPDPAGAGPRPALPPAPFAVAIPNWPAGAAGSSFQQTLLSIASTAAPIVGRAMLAPGEASTPPKS
jgi:hypothetical protein